MLYSHLSLETFIQASAVCFLSSNVIERPSANVPFTKCKDKREHIEAVENNFQNNMLQN
jgi:hypothetical protein